MGIGGTGRAEGRGLKCGRGTDDLDMKSQRRVTMQEVARAAGVHQTTVSLALRNDPRLPAETRARLQKGAREMGYTPDPMLAALNAYRGAKRGIGAPVTMAFVLDLKDRRELAALYPHRMFLEGARERAQEIGYKLEVFYLASHTDAAVARLERTLRARGITGGILGAFVDREISFQMAWEHFSVVLIESEQLNLALHMVANHQLMVTRMAVRRLRELGYRRVGIAVGAREEFYLQQAFTAGYFVELAQPPELPRLPPCLLAPAPFSKIGSTVLSWVRANEIDAVITNWHAVPRMLRQKGLRVPGDVVVATLDFSPEEGPNAGMRQNHRVVGQRAVEQLAILMKTNRRGLVASPNHTLIDGEWVDGSDVPPATTEGYS